MEEDFSKLPKSAKDAREQGEKFYFTGKPCKHGHVSKRWVSGSCVTCKEEYQKSDKYKKYREAFESSQERVEYTRKRNKRYKKENKDACKEYMYHYYRENKHLWVKHYQNNIETIKQRKKERQQETKEEINERRRFLYKNDPVFKSRVVCQNIIRRTVAATNSNKDDTTHVLLGYTASAFFNEIQSKFLEGMSWDNYGEWHIDHKYPVARYIKDGVEDPSIINALDNLIPMWAEDNLKKRDRTLEEFIEDFPEYKSLYGRYIDKEVSDGITVT